VASKMRREGSDRNAVNFKQQLNRHADVDTDLELLAKVNKAPRPESRRSSGGNDGAAPAATPPCITVRPASGSV
jgi:hypothetical protein